MAADGEWRKKSRKSTNTLEYLVKWKGSDQRSWEPEEFLENAQGSIAERRVSDADKTYKSIAYSGVTNR